MRPCSSGSPMSSQPKNNFSGSLQGRFDSILSGYAPVLAKGVILAVSGGRDSLCMADLFLHSSFRPEKLYAVHCNFNLRGKESLRDENLVRNWCNERGLRLFVERFDTRGTASERGVSIEMAARDLRYAFFAAKAGELGAGAVAVAHNAEDNAETLILNLLRGTGIKGICGMKTLGPMPVEGSSCQLLRPMLPFSREDITAYMQREGIAYADDSTNSDTVFRRNSIRHRILPVLRELNPSYLDTLARDMENFSAAAAIVEQYCASASEGAVSREEDGSVTVDMAALAGSPHCRYLLYGILSPYGFNADSLDGILSLLSGGDTFSGRVFLSPTHRAVTSPGKLIIRPLDRRQPSGGVLVPGPGIYGFAGRNLSIILRKWEGGSPVCPPGVLLLDASKAVFPLMLDSPAPGDWLVPIGMKGRKKVYDILAEAGVPADMRAFEPVLLPWKALRQEGRHVLAAACRKSDSSAAVTGRTVQVLEIRSL